MSKTITLPVRHTFTMKIEKRILTRLQDKAFKESLKDMKPVSAGDLVLKALEGLYPELFAE